VFDICYHNTSEIAPTTTTGDMHSVNRANFAILHWFGLNLAPRCTHLQSGSTFTAAGTWRNTATA